jgi:hypothetical protein
MSGKEKRPVRRSAVTKPPLRVLAYVTRGDDAGMVFSCRFVPLADVPPLAGRQGELLHLL